MANDAQGKTITVGMQVEFKADFEQCGTVIEINGDRITIKSESEDGFEGEYIGGDSTVVMDADRCYVD